MGMRTCSYLLFFLALPASAAVISSQNKNIIPPVIVKANPRNNLLTGASKTIVTRQQMDIAGVTSLAQALHELGGVQTLDTTGNGNLLLNLRGFGANASSNTLMLVNGIPITNPDIAPPNLNSIPLQEIEYVEIVAGSESVLYGDQAVGGIINVVTRDYVQDNVQVTCTAGSFNQKNCYAAVNNHYANLQYNLSVYKNRTDNYRDHNAYDQNQLAGKFAYHYPTGRIVFDYNVANEELQYPGALTAAQVRQNRRQANNDTDFFTDWNGFFHFKNVQELTSNWQLETDLAHRDMQGHGVLFSPFKQARVVSFVKPQLTGKIGDTKIVTGADFQQDRYHLSSLFGLTNNHQQIMGLFGVANVPVTTRLTFSLGARGAQQNDNLESFTSSDNRNRAFATTIGTTYQLTPEMSVFLRRAESFRFPKADETAFAPIGVTSLRPQRGVAYETGFELDHAMYSGKLQLYQLNLRDEIAFDPTQTPQQPFGANRNLDPTVRRGLTLSGKRQIAENISLGGQYNYVDARFQSGINASNRIPLVAENIFHAGIDYHFAPRWNLYSEAVFNGNQYSANDDANTAGKLGGYTTYNANLRYQYKQLTASFRVNNILNKYYYLYTVFQPSIQSEFFYPAPGRSFMFTVDYLFS